MAYRADIEIAVRGAGQLGRLQNDIEKTAKAVNRLNEELTQQTLLPTSIKNLRGVVSEAESAMRSAAAGTKVQKDAIDIYVKSLIAAEREERNLTAAIRQRQREMGAASQGGGMTAGKRAESLALGVGFPLLFGGGPGAVLGGAAGSFIGQGFGGQIILSALGAKIDEITASAAKAGVAFTSTSKAFEYVKENALFSSDAVAAHAAELEKEGKAAELATLLTEELAKVIGNDGVEAMKNLGGETTALNKEWKALGLQIQAFIAGPLAGLFRAFSGGLKLFTVPNRYAALTKDLSPADLKALKAAEAPLRVSKGRAGSDLPIAAMETLLGRFESRRISTKPIATTATDLQTITAPKGKAPSDKAEKAAERERARVAEVLRDQRLVTIEIERQSDYSKKIFQAEMAKDPILARRLQGEQRLEEIAIETAGKLEKEKNLSLQLAILKTQEAKAALVYQQIVQDTAKLEQQRKENAQNTILGLQQELKLRNATTEAERNRLRIQYEMDALKRGKQYTDPELQQIEALKKQLAAPETAGEIIQKRIGALQDELTKLTNIGNIAVSVADSIGTAFSQAFQGIISGTMTAQEALASFFQSVGDAFIQMASEIIAKQLTMIILQTILKALGGGGGASPFAGGPATGGETNTFAYAAGAPQFRADGGSVRASTPYLVGERGPELFVPGTSGGVMSNSDLRASMGAAPGSSGGPVLNMSFETSTINGVEYVSRDQLEAAMAQTRRQAARDGAQRGMSMTLDRLQQSPSTRKRVGF